MNKHQCPNCFMEFEDEEEETYGPCRKDETPLPTCCGCAFILFVFIGCWALLYVGGFLCLWFLGKMPNVANPLPAIPAGIGVAGLCALGIHLIVRGKFPLFR